IWAELVAAHAAQAAATSRCWTAFMRFLLYAASQGAAATVRTPNAPFVVFINVSITLYSLTTLTN
ncbi:MAG TPA: hypothetical protein VN829_00925, partial [Dongiaceae bacterium]|nr:hypothetical protein [Dongiaceae bacterium]